MGALASIPDAKFGNVYAGGTQPPLLDAYIEYIAGSEAFVERRFSHAVEHFTRASDIQDGKAVPQIVGVQYDLERATWGVRDSELPDEFAGYLRTRGEL